MLDKLVKIVTKGKKKVGRGYGSGKGGHTTGRGQKGQKSRNKPHILFEGTKVKKSLIQRLPMIRGKGRLKPKRQKPIVLNIEKLNILKSGTSVDINTLVREKLVPKEAKKRGVKIIGNAKLKKKLTIQVPISKSAAESVKAAGGNIQ